MAFADDITVSSDGGTTTHTYSIISMVGGKSIRKDATLELDVPATFTISHQLTGKGDDAIARRMVRFDKTLKDAEGNYRTVSGHIVLTIPQSVVTKADVQAEVNKLTDFIAGSGNLDKLLNGEP